MGRVLACAVVAVCLAASAAHAASSTFDAEWWRNHVAINASERVRGELVDWFRPPEDAAPRGARRYAFFASRFRAGIRLLLPHAELRLQGQDTRLVNLPDDATLGAPFGALGTGGLYFLHTRDRDQGEPILEHASLTLRRRGVSATFGRFDHSDGLETVPGHPTLAKLKRMRIAERLIGPFDFTHVGRSFDGGRFVIDRPAWNATFVGAVPTHGGFEVSANRSLGDVWFAGGAATLKRLPDAPPIDLRLFYLYYRDGRDDPLKTDNRPVDVRRADRAAISIHSWGGHALGALDVGPGVLDGLVWATFQSGQWGDVTHGAWAYAVEAGYQLTAVPARPWLRIGYARASGDADPDDDAHRTFFQLLPTPRRYARLPFFNAMNNADLFAQVLLQPFTRMTLRADYHWLTLTERADLWYQGGGATNGDVFGYAGTPSSGQGELGHLVDLSVDVQVGRHLGFALYYGHAFGGGVVSGTFAGRDADYGYLETTIRF